ncbi:class I SAM-dependent methyltransferase [candidate division CSSED10-310 bacterium]|uniref:Class I SAM-dependent methyltransferase n=1 Tax=candidate division CSSED10-310 bacterium TaxID=2855610 RepID=A0ABV6YWU0_UNCC1
MSKTDPEKWPGLKRRQLRRAHFILDRIGAHLPPALLDFGCGNGALVAACRERSIKAVGVDVGINLLFPIPMVHYDGQKLPFQDNSIEAVSALFVLHHTPDPVKALQELTRVTRHKLLIIEDVWYNRHQKFWLHFFHYLFEYFMAMANLFGQSRWKVSTSFHFRTEQEWLHIFRDLRLKHRETIPLTLLKYFPVKHRIFVLEK